MCANVVPLELEWSKPFIVDVGQADFVIFMVLRRSRELSFSFEIDSANQMWKRKISVDDILILGEPSSSVESIVVLFFPSLLSFHLFFTNLRRHIYNHIEWVSLI